MSQRKVWYRGSWGATAGVVAALILAGTVTVLPGGGEPTPTPTPTATATPTAAPDGTANLWVDTNGGTCGRQSTAGAYSDAAACGSFDAACDASSGGDTIRVRAGHYSSSQSMSCRRSPSVSITGDGPERDSVTVTNLYSSNSSGIHYQGFTVRNPAYTCTAGDGGCATSKNVYFGNAQDITLTAVDVDRLYEVGDAIGFGGDGNARITWTDSDLGHTKDGKIIIVEPFYGPGNVDITFRRNTIGDMTYSAASYAGGTDPHAECVWIQDTENFTLEDNIITECTSTGAMIIADGSDGLLIRNNVFGPKYYFTSGVDVVPGPKTGYRGTVGGRVIDEGGGGNQHVGTDAVIEYNIFAGDVGVAGFTGLVMRGNIGAMAGGSCDTTGVTWLYNLHTERDCSASDVTVSGILDAGNFVDKASHDWRPSSGSAPQVDAGDPSSCPGADADGNARPVGGRCDAGPYEWQGA